MPYRGTPSTDVNDAVRLLVGDLSTSTGTEIFSDGEVDYFVASYANAELAASAAVKSMIGTSRGRTLVGVVKKQVGDLRLEYGSMDINQVLTAKAKQLRMLGVRRVKPYAGGISDSDKKAAEADSDRVKPHFVIGQTDHPGLGINSTSTF
ncbi:MAG: hypothetical protein ACE1ZA_09200 [Pseudomonadales bacterium]